MSSSPDWASALGIKRAHAVSRTHDGRASWFASRRSSVRSRLAPLKNPRSGALPRSVKGATRRLGLTIGPHLLPPPTRNATAGFRDRRTDDSAAAGRTVLMRPGRRQAFTQEITGSNPVGGARSWRLEKRMGTTRGYQTVVRNCKRDWTRASDRLIRPVTSDRHGPLASALTGDARWPRLPILSERRRPATTWRNCRACRRPVKVGATRPPWPCAAPCAAPLLTARRSRAVRCRSRGRGALPASHTGGQHMDRTYTITLHRDGRVGARIEAQLYHVT
jgi:hypothetical protein